MPPPAAGLGSLLDSCYRDGACRQTRANFCRRFLHANSWRGKWTRPDCAPRRRGGCQPFQIRVARAGESMGSRQWEALSTAAIACRGIVFGRSWEALADATPTITTTGCPTRSASRGAVLHWASRSNRTLPFDESKPDWQVGPEVIRFLEGFKYRAAVVVALSVPVFGLLAFIALVFCDSGPVSLCVRWAAFIWESRPFRL